MAAHGRDIRPLMYQHDQQLTGLRVSIGARHSSAAGRGGLISELDDRLGQSPSDTR